MLELKNVELTYFSENGETKAIENIHFTVEDGEFIAILGPSGCGKTTILSLISGLLKPTKGQVLLNGKPIEKNHSLAGYMFQKDHLFEWRTVQKNVQIGLEIKKRIYKKQWKKECAFPKMKWNKELFKNVFLNLKTFLQCRKTMKKQFKQKYKELVIQQYDYADELLKKYGLWDFKNKYPNQLSGGMRQRVALIRTLALDPEILLLDEPFSALDYQTRLNLCDDVSQIIKNENKTTILVTHDITEALSMANKIIVLSKRPATIKNIHVLNLNENLTPLERRESGLFLTYFDTIWKELQSDDNVTK